jgi:hypothetical protein
VGFAASMTRGTHLHWGIQEHTYDTIRGTPGSLREAILFFGYLFVWSLVMGAYIAVFILAGVVTLPLVLVCLPCFLWSKAWSKIKPQRSGHVPKARLIRQG